MILFKKYAFLTISAGFFAVLLCLLYLGKWQLDRLAWKEQLLLETQVQTVSYEPINQAILRYRDTDTKTFYPVEASGTFAHDFAFYVGPRTNHGQAGKHLFTPLHIKDGPVVLVNRGWVPDIGANNISRPQGIVTFQGFMRFPEKPGNFTPKNVPYKDEWYVVDIGQIRERLRIKGFKNWRTVERSYILAQSEVDAHSYPVPVDTKQTLRNPHLGYALTWFGLAFALVFMYLLFIYKWLSQK